MDRKARWYLREAWVRYDAISDFSADEDAIELVTGDTAPNAYSSSKVRAAILALRLDLTKPVDGHTLKS
jgi:hypothetical protein